MNQPASRETVLGGTASEPHPVEPVIKEVRVQLPVERAFALFTEGIGRWWPLRTHSLEGQAAVECRLEGHVGGRLVEIGGTGAVHVWGTVTTWEPPARLVLTWHPGREAGTAQQLEITFTPVESGTRVRLVHTGWERLGELGRSEREDYETGWDAVLERFVAAATP